MASAFFFVLLFAAGMLIWASIFFIWPAVERAEFVNRLSEIRDRIDEAIITGELPDQSDVRALMDQADALAGNAGHASLTLTVTLHQVQQEFGRLPKSTPRTYASLTPDQRRLMHRLQRELIDAFARRLVYGSTFALPWLLVKRTFGAEVVRRATHDQTPQPTSLAREFQRVSNTRTLLNV